MSILGPRLLRAASIVGAALVAATLITCGGNNNNGPIIPEGQHYHYVANQVLVPTNNQQARAYGLDLTGDGMVNNQLGMVLGTLAGMGFDIQTTVNKAVAEGSVLLLVDFQTKDPTFMNAAKAGLTVLLGSNPMPPACNAGETYTCTGSGSSQTCSGCGHQFGGNASFTLAANQTPTALAGPIVGGTFTGGPGTLSLQIALASSNPITLDLIGAKAQASGITMTDIGTGTGASINGGAILAGALTQDDLNNKVIPAIAAQLVPIIQRDCCGCTAPGNPMGCTVTSPQATCNYSGTPSCGCMDGSTGKTILSLFDTNHDCAVSVMEIQTNSLIMSLLAPDVTINGQQALSLGIKITGVGAQFMYP